MRPLGEVMMRLAHHEVRHLALGDIAQTISGLTGKSKVDFTNGNARYVSYKNVFANPSTDLEAPDLVVVADGERQNELHHGDVLFTGSSENLEDVGMSSVVMREPSGPVYLNSFCFALRFHDVGLLPEFSKHLFRSEGVRSQIRRTASGVTRINISKSRFMRVRVPIPPVEVQRELAQFLDAFAELERELVAELDARKSQQLAARSLLPRSRRISALCPHGPERIALGDVATKYVHPIRVRDDETYTSLGVRWYGEGAFAREPKLGADIKATTLYRVKPGQFIYNRMFVTEGSFGLVTEDLAGGVVSNEFPVYDLDSSRVVPEWLYWRFQDQALVSAAAAETTGGTKSRRRWKEEQFEAFEIDLPTVPAQRAIVQSVEAMNNLVDSVTAEIEARRKQYMYYRDKLLTFEEAA